MLGAELDDSGDFRGRFGKSDAQRDGAIERLGIALVGEKIVGLGHQPLGSKEGLEIGNELDGIPGHGGDLLLGDRGQDGKDGALFHAVLPSGPNVRRFRASSR